MSQRWLNLVRDAGPDHPPTYALVRALADYANDQGVSWPYVASLARVMRCSERAVYRRLSAARADGWVTVRSGMGRHNRSTYTLVAERFSRLTGVADTPPENLTEKVTENLTENLTPTGENLTLASQKPDASVTRTTRTPIETSSPADDDALPVWVGVAQADDDETRESLAGIPGVFSTTAVRKLVGVALAERGHTSTTVNGYLRERMSGNPANPMGCLTNALKEIPPRFVAAPPPPPCEACNGTGWEDPDADTLARCGVCHPKSATTNGRGHVNPGWLADFKARTS